MKIYKIFILFIKFIIVQAWYTTIIENGSTVIKTLPRSTQTFTSTYTKTSTTTVTTIPTFTVNVYGSEDCSESLITSSINYGCFNTTITEFLISAITTLNDPIIITFFDSPSCGGLALEESRVHNTCDESIYVGNDVYYSYRISPNGPL